MPAQPVPSAEGDADEVREMASALKSMAEMCQTMMQQETRYRPYWIATWAVIGSLLTVALVLFVVLEAQWIRYFHFKIRSERRHLS